MSVSEKTRIPTCCDLHALRGYGLIQRETEENNDENRPRERHDIQRKAPSPKIPWPIFYLTVTKLGINVQADAHKEREHV